MGKGGGSVPNAPDLSGNVKSADAISSTATDQANQTFNTAKSYNDTAQKNLTTIVGAQTPVMQKLADTTNQNLSTYGSTFAPLQAKQAQDAAAYGSDANIRRLQGAAIADQASAAEASRKRAAAALASEGVDPASIHGGALDSQAAIEAAKAEAGAGTASALNTENTGRQLVNQANELGLQVGSLGNQNASTGAGVAGQLAQDVNATNATGVQNLTANNGLLNTGVSANRSASDIASQQFNDAMKAYQAKQEQTAGGLGAIGGVLGGVGKLVGGKTGGIISAAAPLASFLDGGGPVPGPTDGIAHGVSFGRGGTVSAAGALPKPPNPAHPTDTVPALLTPSEYVIPKDVATHKGHEFFHKLIDKARVEMADRQAIPHAPAVGA